MTLVQLRYLVAIADCGLNMTTASERVHTTQPGMSKQLKMLEDELGFLLFSRKGRSLETITADGEWVIAHARRVLDETQSIRSYAANARGENEGRLVLATTHTQARHVLPCAIASVANAFPQVSVHLRPGDESEVLAQLSRGDADLAVVSTSGHTPLGGMAVPLYRWRSVVLVPSHHPFACQEAAVSLHQLADAPLISYESSTSFDSSVHQAFAKAGLNPRWAMTARDADLIKTYVRAGLGVGLVAEMGTGTAENTGLVAKAAPSELAECTAWAIFPRERVLRDYALALLHALAPRLDRRDIRLALEGNVEPNWPPPPSWDELRRTLV